MKRTAVTIGIALLLVVLFLSFAPRDGEYDGIFYVRVTGHVVDARNGNPVSDALIMTARSRSRAEHYGSDSYRAWIEEWITQTDAVRVEGQAASHPISAPFGCGRGLTGAEGAFTFVQAQWWSFHVSGGCRSASRLPPPRNGIRVLRIEIEGREPVILDAPHGTWTEHPDDDDLWATYDLGVVEVP